MDDPAFPSTFSPAQQGAERLQTPRKPQEVRQTLRKPSGPGFAANFSDPEAEQVKLGTLPEPHSVAHGLLQPSQLNCNAVMLSPNKMLMPMLSTPSNRAACIMLLRGTDLCKLQAQYTLRVGAACTERY